MLARLSAKNSPCVVGQITFTSPPRPGPIKSGVSIRARSWECNAPPLAIRSHQGYISTCEAASCVRSHISPGPYRSFRELSLTGSVDPDIWCPPTFVGNSGIERSNGDRGFALSLELGSSNRAACAGDDRIVGGGANIA